MFIITISKLKVTHDLPSNLPIKMKLGFGRYEDRTRRAYKT